MSSYALLSDIHANLCALEAVLAALPRVDRIWVMGDTVGYGPEPSDVLALLRERGALMVAGNHDLAAATGQGIELFNRHAAAAVRLHREWLSPAERDALASLPLTAKATSRAPSERHAFTLCHGSLRDPIWEYVFTASQADATLRRATTTHCCNGHTHVPAIFRLDGERTSQAAFEADTPVRLDGRLLVNPGSVGQPRDGDPRAAYAVLDTDAGTVTLRRVPYDVAATQRRIRALGLPGLLADRLAIGF